MIRLQCYEGIDSAQAVYEWDYPRQLLHLRAAEATGAASEGAEVEAELYDERFLIRRPCSRPSAPRGAPPVLLIDEVDRADDEFEAFLLEVLSDYTITVPELGTFRAVRAADVVITSNRTRDVHDALKRRCLYHWVEHPDFDREVDIVRARAPEVPEAGPSGGRRHRGRRARASTSHPVSPRRIDWAQALALLGREELDAARRRRRSERLKYREDQRAHPPPRPRGARLRRATRG